MHIIRRCSTPVGPLTGSGRADPKIGPPTGAPLRLRSSTDNSKSGAFNLNTRTHFSVCDRLLSIVRLSPNLPILVCFVAAVASVAVECGVSGIRWPVQLFHTAEVGPLPAGRRVHSGPLGGVRLRVEHGRRGVSPGPALTAAVASGDVDQVSGVAPRALAWNTQARPPVARRRSRRRSGMQRWRRRLRMAAGPTALRRGRRRPARSGSGGGCCTSACVRVNGLSVNAADTPGGQRSFQPDGLWRTRRTMSRAVAALFDTAKARRDAYGHQPPAAE
jgi:hypothetical protein